MGPKSSEAPGKESKPVVSKIAKALPFKQFQTADGIINGSPNTWVLSSDTASISRRASLMIAPAGKSDIKVALYEAEFQIGEFRQGDIETALGYLFKEDPSNLSPPAGFEGFTVFLPSGDSNHCGLMRLTDSTLTYLNLRGVHSPDTHSVEHLAFTPNPAAWLAWNQRPRGRFLAALVNVLGLKALEDNIHREASRRFREAFALDSTAPEYLVNQAALYSLRNDPSGGVDLLLRHPALVDTSAQLCGLLGGFYEDLHRWPEAQKWALKALEKEPNGREWLINLSDALWGQGEKVQSKNVLLGPYSKENDFRLSVYLAGTYLGLEEYDNALKVLERAHTVALPTEKSATYQLRALIGLKNFEEGLDFIRTLGERFPATAENLFLKAVCEFNLRLYRQTLESVQQSLRLDPGYREAQELQTQIAALLGDKSNQLLRYPIPPLPASLDDRQARELLRDSGWETRFTGQSIFLIAQQTVHEWTPRGRWKQTRRMFFKISDGARLFRYSELIFNLNPSYERFNVNRLRIYDSAWAPINEGTLDDYYVTRNPDSDLHPENLLAHIVLKTRPGPMFAELIFTRESQVTSSDFPYVHFENGAGYPVAYSRFELLHPPANLLITPFGDERIDSLPDRLLFTAGSPVFPIEGAFSPDVDSYGSGFTASPFATWRDIGLGYLEQLRKAGIPAQPSNAARNRAAEIAAKFPTDEPTRTLFRYVRDSIRYDNYEFSVLADIPDSTPDVLAKGYADCKGQALLLTEMLRARGVEAHLALVHLYRSGEVGQPHLNQFNHVIVHVPRQRGAGPYFLDPTQKFAAFRRYPLHLEGHNALVLDPANPQLVSIPTIDSAEEHAVHVFHRFAVGGDRTARGCDSVVLRGKAATEFREHMNGWNADARHQNLLSWLASGYSSFIEDDFRILDENNPDVPLTLVLHYHGAFLLNGPRTFDYFPSLELSLLRFPEAAHRRTPVHFPHEIRVESEWTYELPDGYGWKSLSLARKLEPEYLHWRFSVQQGEPRTITLRQQWSVDPFLVDASEYRQLRTEWDPVLQHCGLRLAISRL